MVNLQTVLDDGLNTAVSAGAVPGVVGMVTDREQTLYAGAFGQRVLGAEAAVTVDSVGLLASMTKAITATAAMQLVEQGQLDLHSPAAKWLPPLAQVQVLEGFAEDGTPQLRAPRQAITLQHLLTHTSGFGYEFFSAELARYQDAAEIPPILSSAREALNMPLLFDPGERWNYGIGIDWVGQLIEAVTGQQLGDYLRAQVLEPLGMQDTAFRPSASMRARMMAIHARLPDGSLAPLDLKVPEQPGFDMGGGGLYGTLGDYLKFMRMVLNRGDSPGGRILKTESVAAMCRNQIGALEVQNLKSSNPQLSNDFVLPPGIPQQWSLAWMINTQALPTGRPAGSLMWAGLANSYYWLDLHSGIGGALLMQILPFADVQALPLFLDFEYRVYQQLG